MAEEKKGFAVRPKLDCPHLNPNQVQGLSEFLLNTNVKHFSQFECHECKDKSQNWICMQCHQIGCSRYVQSHMAKHNEDTKHAITLSFSDGSFWCYDCESYIDHPSLIRARRQFSRSKFATAAAKQEHKEEPKHDQEQKSEEALLQEELEKLKVEEQAKSQQKTQQQNKNQHEKSYKELIENLKNKKYTKVVFLTGAGLSVAAGIPDFRTPGTGLYDQLAKYNLPRPESIFQLEYYGQNPAPFIKLSKQWMTGDFKPTLGHKFIRKMQEQNLLHCCMTQNIDDLETKAGVSPQKLIQAHGHSRSARCLKCKKQEDIQNWVASIQKQQILRCRDPDCQAYIKPDIVFFGQQLPAAFSLAPGLVKEADLVFVIGTSLAVWPFAFLAHVVPPEVPLVLINNNDSLGSRKNKIWLNGDIQENVRRICEDLGWKLE